MARDPGTLREVWTILDGLPLLYRTNTEPSPASARTIVHVHGFAISATFSRRRPFSRGTTARSCPTCPASVAATIRESR